MVVAEVLSELPDEASRTAGAAMLAAVADDVVVVLLVPLVLVAAAVVATWAPLGLAALGAGRPVDGT
jgi:hypothetical protein